MLPSFKGVEHVICDVIIRHSINIVGCSIIAVCIQLEDTISIRSASILVDNTVFNLLLNLTLHLHYHLSLSFLTISPFSLLPSFYSALTTQTAHNIHNRVIPDEKLDRWIVSETIS